MAWIGCRVENCGGPRKIDYWSLPNPFEKASECFKCGDQEYELPVGEPCHPECWAEEGWLRWVGMTYTEAQG